MIEPIERIITLSALPPWQRRCLLGTGTLLLFGIYYYSIYWPRQAAIEIKVEQLASLEIARDRTAAVGVHPDEIRQQVADLHVGWRDAVAQLSDFKAIPNLLSSLATTARESGLEMSELRQHPQVYREFFAEVPVEIVVRGTFFEIEAFFQRISELTRVVNVSEVRMTALDTAEADRVRLRTSCLVTTFRFLHATERELGEKTTKDSNR